MPSGNPPPKPAITVDPDIHRQVVEAAAAEGVSVSSWMTAAARRALKARDGLAAVAEWEAEHGSLTAAELVEARRRVGTATAREVLTALDSAEMDYSGSAECWRFGGGRDLTRIVEDARESRSA